TGKEVRKFAGHSSWVGCVAFLPDGKKALSGGYDGTLRLWDVDTGKLVWSVEAHKHVHRIAVSADGKVALTAGFSDFKVWEVATGKETRRFKPDGEGAGNIGLSPDGALALCGDRKGLALWKTTDGEKVATWRYEDGWTSPAVFAPDGKAFLLSEPLK